MSRSLSLKKSSSCATWTDSRVHEVILPVLMRSPIDRCIAESDGRIETVNASTEETSKRALEAGEDARMRDVTQCKRNCCGYTEPDEKH
jgi:hypothetical protein